MKTKVKRKNKKRNVKIYKQEKGITLIALIVTIVIMLILAGVTIKLAIDDNGVIDNAKEAKNQYEQAQADEGSGINELSSEMKKYLNMIKGNSSSDKNNTTTVEGVTIPDGYYYVGGTKAKGIVISDSAADKELDKGKEDVRKDLTGNQWVWVPVDTPGSLYTDKMADLTGSTGVATGRYTNTNSTTGITRGVPGNDDGYACEPDLVLSDGTSMDYTEYSKAGFSSLDDMTETLVNDYYDMTVSIEQYKGFFIGRYELSENGERTGATLTNKDWYELYKECGSLAVTNSNAVSTMIFGLQWDATCIWLKNSGFDLDTPKSWGNTGTNIYATGNSESWKSNNIYDFAGNCIEFTQEKQNSFLRMGRSSKFSYDDCTPTMTSDSWGSRAVLYIMPELE